MRRSAIPKQLLTFRNNATGLLTVRDMAVMYKLNRQTLYRLARKGVVPSIRIGKSLRFDPVQVRAALAAHTPLPGGAPPDRISPGALAYMLLDELLAQNQWTSPPPDLALDRLAVDFPKDADLMSLAYSRNRP